MKMLLLAITLAILAAPANTSLAFDLLSRSNSPCAKCEPACEPCCRRKCCPDDYCPKPPPHIPCVKCFVCDDYCPKCPPRIPCPPCVVGDDYCPKPSPSIKCPPPSRFYKCPPPVCRASCTAE